MKNFKKLIVISSIFFMLLIASGGILFLISKHKVQKEEKQTYIYKDENLAFYREPCNGFFNENILNLKEAISVSPSQFSEKHYSEENCDEIYYLNQREIDVLSVFFKNNQKNTIPCDNYWFDVAFTISNQFFIISESKDDQFFVCRKINNHTFGHLITPQEFKAFDMVFKKDPMVRPPRKIGCPYDQTFYDTYYNIIFCSFTDHCILK